MSLTLGNWVGASHSVLGRAQPASASRGRPAHWRSTPARRTTHPARQRGLRQWLLQLAKTDLLAGLGAIDSMTHSALPEIIYDHAGNKATIIASQLPIEHWHAWIGDATIADVILDRIMQHNHRFTLSGDSQRAKRSKAVKNEKNITPS